MSAREISTNDLTLEEQDNVRPAIWAMRTQFGTWLSLSKVLRYDERTVRDAAKGQVTITASMAFRVARLVGVGIDDLLAGKWPEPGTCPKCGYKDKRMAQDRDWVVRQRPSAL
jgi:hypothetical protein